MKTQPYVRIPRNPLAFVLLKPYVDFRHPDQKPPVYTGPKLHLKAVINDKSD